MFGEGGDLTAVAMVPRDLDASRGAAESVGDLVEGGVRFREALTVVGEYRDGYGGDTDQPVEAGRQVLAFVDDKMGHGLVVCAERPGGLAGKGRPVEPAVLCTRCAGGEVAQNPAVDGGGLDGGTPGREALERFPQELTQEVGANGPGSAPGHNSLHSSDPIQRREEGWLYGTGAKEAVDRPLDEGRHTGRRKHH
ncbi:hypothetical protein ACFWPV_20360 [Streptomyces uncialis]|uniref:hypothetical protein n=1 Tax=Streptomyces uncialis TaxID=1048205 RepID=UPI003654727E